MQQFEVLDGFVVLEGIDGAGTSTQLQLLDKKLREQCVPHICTFEPTTNIIGQQIRKILNKEICVRPDTMALLFTADRHEHLYAPGEGILAELAKGKMVISDRYLFSSLAYQGINCDFDKVFTLNSMFPLPSHLFFIDTPVIMSQQRLSHRGQQELFDAQSFQEQVYNAYKHVINLFRETKMQIHILDGSLSIDSIFLEIWAILTKISVIRDPG